MCWWIMALIHSRPRPVRNDEAREWLSADVGNEKEGQALISRSLIEVSIIIQQMYHMRAWHWEIGLESCIIWWYLRLLPPDKQKAFSQAHLCHERQSTSKFRTPNSSWPHPGRPYVSVPKTKLLSSRARLCKSVQTENTVYSVMCTTSPA